MTNTERKEYAEFHYEGLKEYMQEMEKENVDPQQRLYRILGYVQTWAEDMNELREAEYELQK